MRVVVTRKNRRSLWYIRFVAGNGETVATTQRYFSKSNAVRAASDIVQSVRTERWHFVVEAG